MSPHRLALLRLRSSSSLSSSSTLRHVLQSVARWVGHRLLPPRWHRPADPSTPPTQSHSIWSVATRYRWRQRRQRWQHYLAQRWPPGLSTSASYLFPAAPPRALLRDDELASLRQALRRRTCQNAKMTDITPPSVPPPPLPPPPLPDLFTEEGDDVKAESSSPPHPPPSSSTTADRLRPLKDMTTSYVEAITSTLPKVLPPLPSHRGLLDSLRGLNGDKKKTGAKEELEAPSTDEAASSSSFWNILPSVMSTAQSSSSRPKWQRHPSPRSVQSTRTALLGRTRHFVRSLPDCSASNEAAALRRLEDFCRHLHQHPQTKGNAVRDGAIGELLLVRRRLNHHPSVHILIREALDLLGYHDPPPTRGVRILSLDGGGMRGIVALEFLRAMEESTGKRIHELFDFVCGVSTGSIIASFLALQKKTVAEVDDIYSTLGTKVFTVNPIKGSSNLVMSGSYYDTKLFEDILRSQVGETPMFDIARADTPKMAAIATLVDERRVVPYVFRNYHFPRLSHSFYRGSSRYPLHAAVRASSAAPTYFEDFHLDGKIFLDGGFMINNAASIAVHEAQRLWPKEGIQCVVSLGTGRHNLPLRNSSSSSSSAAAAAASASVKSLSTLQKLNRLVDAATDTELVHFTLHGLLPGDVYYRFNPLMENIAPLDDVSEKIKRQMRDDTQMYIRRNRNRLDQVCRQVLLPRTVLDKTKDVAKEATEIAKAKISSVT